MKRGLFCFCLFALFFGQPLSAQSVSVSADIFPFGAGKSDMMIVPFLKTEHSFTKGVLKHTSFIEFSNPLFSNNIFVWDGKEGRVDWRLEFGGWPDKQSFAKAGPVFAQTFNWGKLSVAPLFVSGTPAFDKELFILWKADPVTIFGLPFHTEGYLRLRTEGRFYGRPQFLFTLNSKLDVGLEWEVSDRGNTLRAGAKIKF